MEIPGGEAHVMNEHRPPLVTQRCELPERIRTQEWSGNYLSAIETSSVVYKTLLTRSATMTRKLSRGYWQTALLAALALSFGANLSFI
jgi:hypothetical protein